MKAIIVKNKDAFLQYIKTVNELKALYKQNKRKMKVTIYNYLQGYSRSIYSKTLNFIFHVHKALSASEKRSYFYKLGKDTVFQTYKLLKQKI